MCKVPLVRRSDAPSFRHECVRAGRPAIVSMDEERDQIVLIAFEGLQPLGLVWPHSGNQRPIHATTCGGNEDRVGSIITSYTKVAVNEGPAAIMGGEGSPGDESKNIVVKKGTIEKKVHGCRAAPPQIAPTAMIAFLLRRS